MLMVGCLSRQLEKWSKKNRNDGPQGTQLRAKIKEKYEILLSYATAHIGVVSKVRSQRKHAIFIEME